MPLDRRPALVGLLSPGRAASNQRDAGGKENHPNFSHACLLTRSGIIPPTSKFTLSVHVPIVKEQMESIKYDVPDNTFLFAEIIRALCGRINMRLESTYARLIA
jgi:hypothetical protein